MPRDQNLDLDVYRYELPGGWTVLAGKTEADNDRLSTRIASPNDWWFHVHGMPGSHVLLREKPGEEPDRDTLKLAAAIAAHHSKARNGGIVPVSCTRARHVRKPRGAKPGTVTIEKEITLKVRPGIPAASVEDPAAREPDSDPRRSPPTRPKKLAPPLRRADDDRP